MKVVSSLKIVNTTIIFYFMEKRKSKTFSKREFSNFVFISFICFF